MAQKTWFITGASRGFGREWAIAALDRGDKVAATARDTSTLDDLVAKRAQQLGGLVRAARADRIELRVWRGRLLAERDPHPPRFGGGGLRERL